MANRYGIDIGKAFADIESIKGARTRNRLAELNLQEAERLAAGRPERERMARERRSKLASLRSDVVSGDPELAQQATRQLLAIEPTEGAKFIDAVAKMDERKLKVAQQNVEEMGKMSSYVLAGETPEEQNRRYTMMLGTLPKTATAKMPKKYDPNFMELSLAKAQSMASILENPKSVRMGGEDVLFKGGKEIARAARPGGQGAGGLKPADESFISREVVQLLGGFYDPATGELRLTDESLLSKAQGIKTEAARIFLESGGQISRSEAVKRAAKNFGEQVLDPTTKKDEIKKYLDYLR